MMEVTVPRPAVFYRHARLFSVARALRPLAQLVELLPTGPYALCNYDQAAHDATERSCQEVALAKPQAQDGGKAENARQSSEVDQKSGLGMLWICGILPSNFQWLMFGSGCALTPHPLPLLPVRPFAPEHRRIGRVSACLGLTRAVSTSVLCLRGIASCRGNKYLRTGW